MTVAELIQELTRHDADGVVRFEALKLGKNKQGYISIQDKDSPIVTTGIIYLAEEAA